MSILPNVDVENKKNFNISEGRTTPDFVQGVIDSIKNISFILWTKSDGVITKSITRNDNGGVIKNSSQCKMISGVGEVVNIPLSEFPEFLKNVHLNQAITHGVPINTSLLRPFSVISDCKLKQLNSSTNTISRTLDHIGYPTLSNSIAMIDYDPEQGKDPWSVDELISKIEKVLPGFKDTEKVITYSTSSCISDENRKEVTGPGAGNHIYFSMPPGTNISRFVELFKVRAWLNGYGYIKISKSGAMLLRNSLFDEFVISPERLDFVAGAVIPEGWTQTRPEPFYLPGCVFFPDELPNLTDDERTTFDKLVRAAKGLDKDKAIDIKNKYITTRAADMHTQNPDIPLKHHEETIRQACNDGDLYGDFKILIDGGAIITVSDILKDPRRYDGASCSDPLEPNDTAGKAKVFINQGEGPEKPVIKSFWHGDHIFFLHPESVFDAKHTLDDVLQWISTNEDNRDILCEWLGKIKGLNSVDVDTIKNAIQKKTGVKISILNKGLKDQRARDAKAKVKANVKETSKKRAQIGIKEILYHSTQTGICCHELSTALRDHPEKRIYRFAGNIIKIVDKPPSTVRMVKKNHDLGGFYPSMPVISQLAQETLCHEAEKVAVCQTMDTEGTKKDIPWPKNILTGVMALTEYHEKPLSGIVEHPYIDDNFEPMETQGYDDTTGLYRIFCVVPEIGFFKTSKDALNFLMDKLFQDFSFASKLDHVAAVSCLLTGMQRKLITDNSGCPGYLFTAPVQSSGKTTLCQAINYSLYGRPAAATSYSSDDTEMAKHLLGILQEGISAILFDNLPEGSVIESNELAKAITSDSYSNRWLGKNKTVTVPSSVLWLMTGNNISVCGDFNTRFLPVELDTKDANPDQRRFDRIDIGAWCEQYRGKILGACMKIIIDGKGYSNPDIKPTRFPSWDKFVRFPLFKTSGIDIAEIFQKNKLSDPKIEGQNNFFEAWFNAFGSNTTTAKQVLNHCRSVSSQEEFSGIQDDNEMADATRDIFTGGDLPSTRALGKWLSGMKNRFFGEYKLTDAGIGTNREQVNKALWVVLKK